MVILKQRGSSLQVCGGLKREPGKVRGRAARLYVVVRQGDAIATGEGTCEYDQNDENTRWKLPDVKVPKDLPSLRTGPALACGVAIVEEDQGGGLEAFSWLQQVNILARNPSPEWDPPTINFPAPQQVFPEQGQLDAAQAIASSLTVIPSDGGNYRWTQELEIRPLATPSQ
jgi:hypothetical protein